MIITEAMKEQMLDIFRSMGVQDDLQDDRFFVVGVKSNAEADALLLSDFLQLAIEAVTETKDNDAPHTWQSAVQEIALALIKVYDPYRLTDPVSANNELVFLN